MDVFGTLSLNKGKILASLNSSPGIKKLNYVTFGVDIEDYVILEVKKILQDGGFVKDDTDYKRSKDKNEFPDLVLTRHNFVLDIKAGNMAKRDGKGGFVVNKNSNNDMGTLRSWPTKLAKFGGENIYFLFVIYNFNDTEREIVDIQIDHFYKFLALSKDGLALRYREKDGNLRPRDFNSESKITSLAQFEKLLDVTNRYRSLNIIRKHARTLAAEDLATLSDELKAQLATKSEGL